ncbi:MAG: DUF5106 domain-containing protein [Bacteroidales bacterium]|nr:DUF5106 domain-containing protein [Bacteroidales bacterium]
MRLSGVITAALLAVFAVSCKAPSVKGFWDRHTPDITDIRTAEDEFAEFAELAVAAPEQDAQTEINHLYDLLKADEVAYYVYTEWVVRAFYSSASPCRNCGLFVYSMERILSDGIIEGYDAEVYQRFVTACKTNRAGDKVTLPVLHGVRGEAADMEAGKPTLFMVVDLSCPSCLRALEKYAGEHPEARHIALCSGPGRFPDVEGWEFYRASDTESVYDVSAAPFYFLANSDGIIEIPYTRAL